MSTEAVVSAIKESVATGTPLRIGGRSTWLDAGRPVRATKTISLHDDSGVVSYVPGDLTLTVRAGTPLSEIERVTREHDQWLPLDPYGALDGTIGATIATASAGPLSTGFGLPRDLLLGLEFVNGRGEVVRGGGKVVKNVAGFDLSRLMTGSWGTLGVITEVTLRLYALPATDRTFSITLAGGKHEVAALIHGIATSPLSPYALQLLSRSAAHALGLGDNPVCLIRFGGNEAVCRKSRGPRKRNRVFGADSETWRRTPTRRSGSPDSRLRFWPRRRRSFATTFTWSTHIWIRAVGLSGSFLARTKPAAYIAPARSDQRKISLRPETAPVS